MVKATKAKESRQRDSKRNRILLTIGAKSWHLSQAEVKALIGQMSKLVK